MSNGSGVVGALRINLSLNSANFETGMRNSQRQLTALNSEFRAITSGSGRFDNSLESLRNRSDVLTRTMTVHRARVEELRRQYEQSARETGENSDETLRLATAYNRAIAAMNRTEQQLGNVTEEIERQSDIMLRLRERLDQVGTSFDDAGQKMRNVGATLTTGVTAPIIGLGAATAKIANDFDSAAGVIQSELGITAGEAEKLQNTAETLWKEGFGEDLASVSSRVAGVTKALGELSEVDLSYVTKGLDLFEKRGWGDQTETLRAMNVLMEQFGMTSTEAMDYLTKGFQENLNFSGEFLDSVSEYSTYFAELGFSSDEMFAKLKSGAESGAFQLDKVGDSLKEFSLRAKDGSKTSTEAFQALGLNAEKMTKEFNSGGESARKAFETVVKALQKTDNETLRNTVSVGLFGTQYEDLGEKAFDAMLETTKGLEGVEGATKKASDALRDNFGTRATKVWRDFQTDLLPIGEELLDIAEDVLPKVADTLDDVTGAFAKLSPEGQKNVLMLAGLTAAAGPVLTGIGGIASGVGILTRGLTPLITAVGAGGLSGAFAALTGPVGLTVAGLGAATAAGIAITDAFKKAKEVNLEHTQSLIDDQLALENSVVKYEDLRGKLQLNNDQFAKYLDLQDKIKSTTDPKAIESYKNQMAGLQEKSGLTVEELAKFIEIDADIRENAPETQQKISEYGNAFIDLSSNLQPILDKQREFITNQLEIEKDNAYDQLKETADEFLDTQEKLNETIQRHNDKLIEQAGYRQKAKDIQGEINQAEADGDIARAEHFKREQAAYSEKATNMQSEIDRLYDGFAIEQERLNNLQSRVAEESKVYDQLVEQELKMVNINGKSSEALSLIDAKIQKLQAEKSALENNYKAGALTTEEYQEQNQKINTQIEKLRDSRGRVVDIQGEQKEVTNEIRDQIEKGGNLNTILSEDTVKDVNVDDHGTAKKVTDEAKKGAHKKVKVDDNGGTSKIQKDAEKEAKKDVKTSLKAQNSIWDLLPRAVSVGVSFLGKLPGFASGTQDAPGGIEIL